MSNLEKAKELLATGYTCVLVKGEQIFTSNKTGIKPMMEFITNNVNLVDFSAADKIVGRAAAHLFILAGVKELYAEVISQGAFELLNKANIKCLYNRKVENIINRLGTGICPMEECVKEEENSSKAFQLLQNKLASLR